MVDEVIPVIDIERQLLSLLQARGYRSRIIDSGDFAARSTDESNFEKTVGVGAEVVDVGPILQFQQFYGLKQTGMLDLETTELLFTPRCGVPDPTAPLALRTGSGGWPTAHLTFAFENLLPGFPPDQIRSLITEACSIWANSSPLAFTEKSGDAHINIRFGPRHHGDEFPFDERELAHAFFPDHRPKELAGQIHFDTEENWSADAFCPPDAKDLLSIAIHEIGHAVGLDHVGIRRSVMFANYQGMQRTLYSFDIEAINSLYTD